MSRAGDDERVLTTTARESTLEPALIDLLTEAVVWASDAAERADVLLDVVACAVESLQWRLAPEGSPPEEASALQVLQAAAEHVQRVRSSGLRTD